ncbi:MAG: DUF4147 domain-containing protein [Candidatus Doudnabacteria bacterium]|nr:DUF4147 domain-containing protein [Candidatus Doudnabacteria bacterium]
MFKNRVIKNFEALATSSLRKQALLIAEAGFGAINTTDAILEQVKYNAKKQQLFIQDQKFDLSKFKRIIYLCIGKVALEAATALSQILGERITRGFVIDVKEGFINEKIICRAGTHPLISEQNINYTKEALSFLEDLTKDDLVIFIVSGGGSALFELPFEITAEKQAEIFKALTKQGANIKELNTVRKHISLVKGGQLAKKIYPASLISLVFSDVPGDDLSMVASGPSLKDSTTAREAQAVLEKYKVTQTLNLSSIKLVETPKEEKYFINTHNFLIVSPARALLAMREKAEEMDFKVEIFSKNYQGEARKLSAQIIQAAKAKGCLLGAGESSVIIKGNGTGGRNQEMALAALPSISENQVFVALASDGRDNTEAAGAIVDESTIQRAKNLGLDPPQYLENNDSFTFFEAVGDAVMTGLTGSNVADFFVCLKR